VPRPDFLGHPRLRRASQISHYATAAAVEALGTDCMKVKAGELSLGLIYCVTSGCITYTRRFYDEVLKNPATASPLLFPETVFNAPAGHLAAVLGTRAPALTLVGDQGTFLLGLATAGDWLSRQVVDACLVVGAEELDWVMAYAVGLLDAGAIAGDGAGALYLRQERIVPNQIELAAVTSPVLYANRRSRLEAARQAMAELPKLVNPVTTLLCDGLQGSIKTDQVEQAAWDGWSGPRISPKRVLGEGLMASVGWQCAVALDLLSRGEYLAANVSVVGCNQQAIGALFRRCP
jgi:hypothetical protein